MVLRALCLCLLACCAGCQPADDRSAAAPGPLVQDASIRLHWLGKKRLGVEGSAYFVMRLWDLPQSKVLEAQTLDKLSVGIWPLLGSHSDLRSPNHTQALRPLLDDLVQEEWHLELRYRSDEPFDFLFAIRVPASRSGLWETNLAVVAQAVSGVWPTRMSTGDGWILETSPRVRLVHTGGWTILSRSQKEDALFSNAMTRIQRFSNPFATSSNCWLEADFDLSDVAKMVRVAENVSSNLPRVSFTVSGDGANTILRGKAVFPSPLHLQLPPWTMPVRLMHEPLVSFIAIRGLSGIFTNFSQGQVYSWGLDNAPLQVYAAAPVSSAGEDVRGIFDLLLKEGNAWLARNSVGELQPIADSNAVGVAWSGLPHLSPAVQLLRSPDSHWLYAGTLPDTQVGIGPPPSEGMIQDVLRRTNLVFYQWEMGGPQLDTWLYLGQMLRTATHRPEIPMNSLGISWLSALRPRLGTCAAIVTKTSENELTFVRKATVGLSAVELHLLVDWLESPRFPAGLHSMATRGATATNEVRSQETPKG